MNTRKSIFTYISEAIDQYRTDRGQSTLPETSRQKPGRLGRIMHWLVPNGGTLLLVLLLVMTQSIWAKPLQSPMNAPGPSATTVNYQGRLADSAGTPLSGTYGMSFALYDAPTGGALVWGPESHTAVPVSDGLFSVGLGSQTSGGIPTSVWDGDRYLEITVGGETLSPRELIRSVPIAGMALTVPDGAINGEQIGISFGSSSKELLNFVVRNISSTPDLELSDGNGVFVNWDVSSIVGDTAVAVIVYVRVADDAQGSYAQFRKPGTSGVKTAMAGIFYSDGYKGYYEFVVPCDVSQNIQYRIRNFGTDPIEAQFWIVGWYEPANR